MALTVDRAEANHAVDALIQQPQRPAHLVRPVVFVTWHVASLALLTFLMLAVTQLTVVGQPDNLDGPPWLRGLTLGSGVLALLTLFAAAVLEPAPSQEVVPRLWALWRDPPGDWLATVLGVLLSFPLLGLFTPTGLGDADSVRIVAAVRYVQDHGMGFLVDTQDNFGPHLVLGPAVTIGGVPAVRLVSIISLQALVAVLAYVARRLSGSMMAAVCTALATLSMPAVVARATLVPMYPAMLAFGTLGCWFAYRAMSEPRNWRHAVGAGLCFVAALELQTVGQLFLAVPVLLLIACPGLRQSLAGLARVAGTIVVLLGPRLAVNLSEGGLSRLTSNRTDYWINKGYTRRIQTDFWNYAGVGEPASTYLERLPRRFVLSFGDGGWVAVAVAAMAILGMRGRARWFALACATFMFTAASVKQVPPFPRYFSPLWPGVAILAGLAAARLLERRALVTRAIGVLVATLLLGLAGFSHVTVADATSELVAEEHDKPYRMLAAIADDGKGVIGARSHVLTQVTADIPTYGGQFLSERDYVTYLTWPSDAAVVAMLNRYDIGWVLVNANMLLEVGYHNTWLIPNYDQEARHVTAVEQSPSFCLVAREDGFLLYRLGPCPERTWPFPPPVEVLPQSAPTDPISPAPPTAPDQQQIPVPGP